MNRVIACRMMFVTLSADHFRTNEKLWDPIKAKASFVWVEKSVLRNVPLRVQMEIDIFF